MKASFSPAGLLVQDIPTGWHGYGALCAPVAHSQEANWQVVISLTA